MSAAYYQDGPVRLFHGDCIEVMRELPDASVDAVVTDPPYGLEFMGREWDSFKPSKESKPCATPTEIAPTTTATTAPDASGASGTTANAAPAAGASGAPTDLARAASATIVEADAIGGFQDGNGGNAYSRSRVRTNTQRHGGDSQVANRGFGDWCEAWARECLRVLKPGGHLLAFGGSRTWHRLAVAVEDAGFEIRDSIAWLYSQGFPKSMNVGADQRFCQCGMGELKHGSETGKHAVEQVGTVDVPGLLDRVSPLSDEAAGRSTADLLAAVSGQARRGLARSDGGEHEGPQTGGRAIRRGQPGVEGRRDVQTPSGQLRSPADGSVPSGVSVDGEVERLHSVAPARDGAVDRPSAGTVGVREPQGSRHLEQRPVEPRALPDEPGSQAGRGWPVCGGCGKPQVAGWGTALKPAFEPIVVGRKPLAGTVAANVLEHRTGSMNIDGCRVETDEDRSRPARPKIGTAAMGDFVGRATDSHPGGRWPTNVLMDESQAAALDEQTGIQRDGTAVKRNRDGLPQGKSSWSLPGNLQPDAGYSGEGGGSRFFPTFRYEAKAPSSERPNVDGVQHPTVKPLDLMAWLCRLVTPAGGIILEPFAGSGTTLEAALGEGFQVIGIEREADYLPLIMSRLQKPIEQTLFGGVA